MMAAGTASVFLVISVWSGTGRDGTWWMNGKVIVVHRGGKVHESFKPAFRRASGLGLHCVCLPPLADKAISPIKKRGHRRKRRAVEF
jgi:hypothetical protein